MGTQHWLTQRMIDAAPLQAHVRRKADIEFAGSVNSLASHICHRLDLSPKDCVNQLHRLNRKDRISIYSADRLCVALGVHVIDLYGFDEYAKGMAFDAGTDDVMDEEDCC